MTEIGKLIVGTIIFSFFFGMVCLLNIQSSTGWFLPAPPDASDVYVAPTRKELIALVNQERINVGAPPLVEDVRLDQSAQLKADDMFDHAYFDHVSPTTGKKGASYVIDVAKGLCHNISENLEDLLYNKTAAGAVDAWMKSKAHHDAMLDPQYTLTGFGIQGDMLVEHFCQVR